MGSAAHAILVTKQNRALQRTGSKGFLENYKTNGPNTRKTAGNRIYNPGITTKEAFWGPALKILMGLALSITVTIYSIGSLGKLGTIEDVILMVEGSTHRVSPECLYAYRTWIEIGYENLRNDNYSKAYDYFRAAERQIPYSAHAYIGIMLSYYASCDEPNRQKLLHPNKTYCDEADSYRSKLIDSGVITSHDIDQLIYSLRACNYAALVPANIGTKLKSPKSSS